MPKIEGFRVQGYRVLKDVTLGRIDYGSRVAPLTPLVVVIGKNGSGKSTLFDAFGFLADCLSVGVEAALDKEGRGGYERVLSKDYPGPIRFDVYYRESPGDRPISYELSIALDSSGRPFVESEILRQRRKGQKHGRPFPFLRLEGGRGDAWSGDEGVEGEDSSKVPIELDDPRRLGIATLGALREHPRIARFRRFIENWYLSYFAPDAARSMPTAGPQKHLNIHGDNLGNVVQFMEREYGERFQTVLDRISSKIPGIGKIDTEVSPDKRLLLRFHDKGFTEPFYAQQMSDGTLKIFTYLLLLEDPEARPFICIEEPENGLYHKLLETLAEEFRAHATGEKGSSQLFITTHQPYFVDALTPEETWVLEKGEDGFATISRASDNEVVKAMVEEGLPLGSLWYSDYLDAR